MTASREPLPIAATAAGCLAAGLCVLPANRDEKRPALDRWKPYQQRLPTAQELDRWFRDANGMCLITGAVSGNLEMIDFDAGGESFEPWAEAVRQRAPGLLERLAIERSQSGGRHVVYRCESPVNGSMKLAQRAIETPDEKPVTIHGKVYHPRRRGDRWIVVVTLIETRGEGGLFLCAPTPGYELIQGRLTELPVLTEDERIALLDAAWQLNEWTEPLAPGGLRPVQNGEGRPGPPGDRPGDDFNQRGDVAAILRKHGWTLVRTGENQYWRRPGKDSGWSATLKDRVFYVFSSNAPPFEMNRAYSPFAVHTLLEHAGNYEQAARTLRQLGYGGEGTPDDPADVDITAIVQTASEDTAETDGDDAAPDVADPGPIPERLFHVPGFVARVMDFTLANAPYPNVGLAFCGALALQSYLCGRKVCTPGDLRSNLYLLALASSGTGKDFPRKVNARVLLEIGQVGALGDKFASGEGIQDALVRCNAMLFQNDEMDGVLRQINLDRDNRRESIPNILLTLYTSANDVYPIRVKAGQKETIHIDQPHLALFGTATPQYFYEALSQRMLTNGFFARLIIVDIGQRGAGQTPGSARHLPDAILDVARWWAEFVPARRRGNMSDLHPEPRVVPFSPDALAAIESLQRQTEREYDQADARNDEVGRTAWSRTCENAKKLALVYACSQDHENPVIDLDAVEWATEFAMHQTRRQLYLAATYVASSEFDGLCKKAVRFLKQCRDSEKGYPVPDWRLRRHLALSPKAHSDVTEALVKQQRIRFVTITAKTKPRSGWMLR